MSNVTHAPHGISMGPYLALMSGYVTLFGGALALATRRRRLPVRIATADVLLLGVATHALTRIVTRDVITSAIRAPFTEFQQRAGGGEEDDRARGTGLRHAIGELLTCPYCAAPSIAASLFVALLVRPRATRVAASVLAAVALSNFLNQGYAAARTLS